MLRIDQFISKILLYDPWDRAYAIARTLLALSSLLLVLFNNRETLFTPILGSKINPCISSPIVIFCTVSNFAVAKLIVIVLLLLVLTGFYPRYTAILHWLITYSIQYSVSTVDGGAQINYVLVTLLLPLCLLDSRKNHWLPQGPVYSNPYIHLFAVISVAAIRLQMALLYFHAFSAKLLVNEWSDGTAFYYWINNYYLGANPAVNNLFGSIITSELVVLITWGSLVIEILLFMGLLARRELWRPLFFLGIGFHTAIAFTFGLITFGLSMAAGLTLYFLTFQSQYVYTSHSASRWGRGHIPSTGSSQRSTKM